VTDCSLVLANERFAEQTKLLANRLQLPILNSFNGANGLALVYDDSGLCLYNCQQLKSKPLRVEFNPSLSQKQIGKKQNLCKACGITSKFKPNILDATAGLGSDALVFADHGCNVTMLERSPIMAALLRDGLERLKEPLKGTLTLQECDAIDYLREQQSVDVVYLDPMHPERKKSALVKQNLRLVRAVVGDDAHNEELLAAALLVATKRVVVKRPKLAEPLGAKPDHQFIGRSTRFDVYYCH